ncbi:MAG: hypothetical protein CVT94_00955 [Bacteroidetes bacterium HGW-Bacteroidetes-11]|jgi:hypothetical protein|nr:MAG: hypothetical protein CVT94_00955 [Bacteroidetes bacterium HGW-Bacteroidetes-11]
MSAINRTPSGLQDPAMSSRSFGIELYFDRLNTAHFDRLNAAHPLGCLCTKDVFYRIEVKKRQFF